MTPSISLAQLLPATPGAVLIQGDPDVICTDVTNNSRAVQPGSVFVAVPGFERDGAEFIPQALAAGAIAIVSERQVMAPLNVCVVTVSSARAALADLAAALWDHPSRKLQVIGVTGTDGKTSTAQIIGTILRESGKTVGWLTTAGIQIGDRMLPNNLDHTTPEAPAVQKVLADMVEHEVDTAVLEVSSHALELDRVRGCEFIAAVFTNLSPEHLNFHGTLEAYAAAKSRLFGLLRPSDPNAVAAINLDDAAAQTMILASAAPVVTYALHRSADFTAEKITLTSRRSQFTVHAPGTSFTLETSLLGEFNVANWLGAIAVCMELGASVEEVQRAAAHIGPVRGRMESINAGQPFLLVVDFAHTPQALETALKTLRPYTSGRVLTLFGQAGGRDPANRPAMGRIATGLSDFFLITLDDPIHEDPESIAAAIEIGAREAGALRGRDYDVELDRHLAVERLIQQAQPGDVVLLAGKGHEQRMLVGDAKLPWDDAREAREAVLRRFGPARAEPH